MLNGKLKKHASDVKAPGTTPNPPKLAGEGVGNVWTAVYRYCYVNQPKSAGVGIVSNRRVHAKPPAPPLPG